MVISYLSTYTKRQLMAYMIALRISKTPNPLIENFRMLTNYCSNLALGGLSCSLSKPV